MSDATETPGSTSASRAKPKASPSSGTSKPEMPGTELPKMEIPAALRDLADKGVTQAKETYEKIRSVAEEATDVIEDTYSTASKGLSDLGLKVIEAVRENTNSGFDFASHVLRAKSVSEVVELSMTQARKQFEAVTTQTKEIGVIAQKLVVDTAEPVKERLSKVFKTAA
jgi:phasin